VAKSGTLRVFGVGMSPTTVRRKLRTNHTVDKGLNRGSRCSILLGRDEFTVGVAEEDEEVGMNLVEDPAQSTPGSAWHGIDGRSGHQ